MVEDLVLGYMPKRDMTGFVQDGKEGRPLGNLRYVGDAPSNKYGQQQCKFLCDPTLGCSNGGKELVAGASPVLSGHTLSCGCLRTDARRAQGINARKFDDTHKWCPACEHWLKREEFRYSASNPPSYLQSYCKKCRYLSAHHFTLKQYEALIKEQKGVCAFPHCLNLPEHIDHDHQCCNSKSTSCGKCVRGVLCRKHNVGLGMFSDSPKILLDAIGYLQKNKQQYVLGFLFDVSLRSVVLIRKKRPGWQKHKLNGVGGKVEAGESPHEAMVLEFREEAGVDILEWNPLCLLQGTWGRISCFFSISPDYDKVQSITDEEVSVWEIDALELWRDDVLPNIRWMIAMALSLTKGETAPSFTIIENEAQ